MMIGSRAESPVLRAAAFAILAALAIGLSFTRIADDDVFWHLATGRWILEHRAIPHEDVFGFITRGQPWVPSEWGWDVLSYGAYWLTGGYIGVQLLCVLGWLGISILQAVLMKRLNVSTPVMLVVVSLMLFTSLERMTPRPHLATAFFLTVVIYLLDSAWYASSKKYSLLLVLPPMFLVWANAHPGVLAGLFLLLLYMAAAFTSFVASRNTHEDPNRGVSMPRTSSQSLRVFSLILVLCAAATLLNPGSWNTFSYAFAHTKMKFLAAIEEWTPPFAADSSDNIIWFYKASLLLGSTSLLSSWRMRDPLSAVLYVGFGVYSLQALRFIPDFAIVTAPGTALALEYFIRRFRPALRDRLQGSAATAALLALLLYIVWLIPDGTLSRKLRYRFVSGVGVDGDVVPVSMVDFMKRNGIAGRPFNQFDVGGEIVWEVPRETNFIDSRNLNDRIGDEYSSILEMNDSSETMLSRYDIDHIIVHLRDLRESPQSMLNTLIPYCTRRHDRWKLVYWDDQSFLYLRSESRFSRVIDSCELRLLNPYLFVFQPQLFDSMRRTQPAQFERELKIKLSGEPGGFIVNYIAQTTAGTGTSSR